MFKRNVFSRVAAALVLVLFAAACFIPAGTGLAASKAPKYVFYFIGDGLGAAQRQVAEFYLQEKNGDKNTKLLMNTFPVAGINTTHSSDTLVTDSAAAGTALATGMKTNNGIISMLPDGTRTKTLMETAEEKGMGTGLISTTRITHATPAAFASHNVNRDNENEIAEDIAASGVDFIAGGGFRHFVPQNWQWGKSKRKDDRNLLTEMLNKGYNVFTTMDDTQSFLNFTPKGKQKVVALLNDTHIPYDIDRINSNLDVPTLAQMTQKGIDVLSKYEKGFFMMIEGGRIDHACHANDAAGSILDTLAFDESVKSAYDFYLKHPNDTLIVIVGDHETGGLGLGFGKNYFLKLDELFDAKVSVEDVLSYGNGAYKKGANREEYFKYLEQNLGLDNLTDAEKASIIKAMDLVDSEVKSDASYGSYNQVAIAATHAVSERANLQWTTYAHSGTAIPMSAIGVGATNFGGYKDNTEIAKAMAELMGFKIGAIK
ncbi:alkaline phosphatase [Petroclostridium sp. X23]|uniref:alkaline phosphatase n=1 Tax=Petroclostridium sp. X23 TaxID=3045146 RepID=UPI0024AD66B6|nr:alkaline phosphatase [Petroclostridium sp. X23]WHH60280.1 alkaline phosphatase [Petroclostridium sp. X23]